MFLSFLDLIIMSDSNCSTESYNQDAISICHISDIEIKGLVTSFLTYFYFLTNQKDLKNEIQRYQNHSVKILRSDFTS